MRRGRLKSAVHSSETRKKQTFREGNEVYHDMNRWTQIRLRIRQGEKKSQILEETGMHWKTLEKILTHPEPPGYRMQSPRPKPKLGPYLPRLHEILQTDRESKLPQKQRHTAKKIFERIRAEGYSGGYTQIKEAVRNWQQVNRGVYFPLAHPPGEAQVDFG